MAQTIIDLILAFGESQHVWLAMRIFFSLFCGFLLGMYRTKKSSAGVRTFMLITVGATLFTLVSIYGFVNAPGREVPDPSRLAAQIISGIGFLCAGLIWKEKHTLHGLTTAAGAWGAAGIGIMVGVGWYLLAVLTTLLVILIFELKRYTERVF